MKRHNFLYMQAIKGFIILGIIGLNNSIIYSQETMEDAIVSLSFLEENNSKIIVTKAVDQSGLPIEDLELFYYVKRTFSLLPVGDPFNATDGNGIVEVEFPNDLPGDTKGDLTIVVKIIDSDLYNDLTLETTKNWGLMVEPSDSKTEERSLWAAAANAPISLILIVSIMIISVWYIISYILFKLYKISKIKPIKDS